MRSITLSRCIAKSRNASVSQCPLTTAGEPVDLDITWGGLSVRDTTTFKREIVSNQIRFYTLPLFLIRQLYGKIANSFAMGETFY